ncbi:MAG: hypothetical protein ABS944_15245 [Solibacillus sp.]
MKKMSKLLVSALLLSVMLVGASASASADIGPCKPGEKFCHIPF